MSSSKPPKRSDRPTRRVSGTVSQAEIEEARKTFQESLAVAADSTEQAEKLRREFKKKIRSPSCADLVIGLLDDDEEDKVST